MTGTRTIRLRWRGRCRHCRVELPSGTEARFDDVSRLISCLDCAPRDAVAVRPTPAERERSRAAIAEARAALASARRAS